MVMKNSNPYEHLIWLCETSNVCGKLVERKLQEFCKLAHLIRRMEQQQQQQQQVTMDQIM